MSVSGITTIGERVYTMQEFCTLTHLPADHVRELVALGILEPRRDQERWTFTASQLNRCMKAERLRQDLELNLHGVALALELMERNSRLRRRVTYLEHVLERFYGKI